MVPVSSKGGGTCFAFPDVCLVPATPSPLPDPFPIPAQVTDAHPHVPSLLIDTNEVGIPPSALPPLPSQSFTFTVISRVFHAIPPTPWPLFPAAVMPPEPRVPWARGSPALPISSWTLGPRVAV